MKFYQALTKQQRAHNRIVGLYNMDDEWVTQEKEVENVAVNYFSELFTSTSPDKFDDFLGEVPTVITDQINDRFTGLATEEEIRKVIFMMHPEKAPGPDGMTALFYQRAWSVIKVEVLDYVNDFLRTSSFD